MGRWNSKRAYSLAAAEVGKSYRVINMLGGRNAMLRLASLGILPGEKIKLIRKDSFGPLLIEVKGTRLILGRGVSAKIAVVPDEK